MKVDGTVSMANTFGVASIVGGSRGEAVPWATTENGTYTLIGNTTSTFSNITNFGAANAVVNVAGSGKTVYFQNGGGTAGGGLQIVVATDAAIPSSPGPAERHSMTTPTTTASKTGSRSCSALLM